VKEMTFRKGERKQMTDGNAEGRGQKEDFMSLLIARQYIAKC